MKRHINDEIEVLLAFVDLRFIGALCRGTEHTQPIRTLGELLFLLTAPGGFYYPGIGKEGAKQILEGFKRLGFLLDYDSIYIKVNL